MRVEPTRVNGIWEIHLEPRHDERGWFARLVDTEEITRCALQFEIRQSSASFNRSAGTLRGMHFQAEPHGEIKVVRCTRGAVFDVGVDIDPASSSYGQWHGLELTPDNERALLLGPRIAHGFQTLMDDTEVHYLMGAAYVPEAQRGIRWDDPRVGIAWPAAPHGRVISDRDQTLPLLEG
jgi:dTDP-4-dehydrorhamnose 3,5-epimerase